MTPKHLPLSLFLLRLGVFVVMGIWTIDKFVNPGHAAKVAEVFYAFPAGVGPTVFYVLGALQAIIVLAFIAGAFKFWSYGLVLVMHAISTLSSWPRYLEPWEATNLLFFAAWPMLAACVVLFLMRDEDRMLAVH